MSSKFIPELKVVDSLEKAQAVEAAAAADGHYVFAPTHYVEKDGKIISYFSAGIVPVGHFWVDSKVSPFVSHRVISACVELGRRVSPRFGAIACSPKSPFHRLIERHFGFNYTMTTSLFVKDYHV